MWTVGAHLAHAAASLALHVIAARRLGSGGLAEFATIASGFVMVGAVAAALVSDPLTTLAPLTPELRAGLERWALLIGVGVTVIALLTTSVILPRTEALQVAAGAALVGATEVVRRVCALRGHHAVVAIAETTGALVTMTVALHGPPELRSLVLAILAGQAVIVTILALTVVIESDATASIRASRPIRSESHGRTRCRADLASVWRVGRWRLMQHTLRPTLWTTLRALAIAKVGADAWGEVESARLVVAPATVVANGTGVALLVSLATDRPQTLVATRRRARRTIANTLLLQAASVSLTLLALSVLDSLRPHANALDWGSFDRVAMSGWAALAIASAVALPVGVLTTALGTPERAARSRTTEVAMTVVLSTALLAMGGSPVAVPWLAAASVTIAGTRLWRSTARHDSLPPTSDVESTSITPDPAP